MFMIKRLISRVLRHWRRYANLSFAPAVPLGTIPEWLPLAACELSGFEPCEGEATAHHHLQL